MTRLEALARNPWARGLFVLASLVLAIVLLWWRGPEWDTVYHAFDFVSWRWVVVGVILNLLSVLARALSWNVTIHQALPPPRPTFPQVFSSFGVGLLGNAVLPARAGELARVAVLRRHLPGRPGTSATLLGTVFSHRLFDLFPIALLVVYVLATAKMPHWAVTGIVILGMVGLALLAVAIIGARRAHGGVPHGPRSASRLLAMARQGLAVLRTPAAAFAAILLQTLGWVLQLLAVWAVTAQTARSCRIQPIVCRRIAATAAAGVRSTARPCRAIARRRIAVRWLWVGVPWARRAPMIATARSARPTRPRITSPVTAQCGIFAVATT